MKGPIAINPVSADLKLDLKDFGLVPLQPYFADQVNILITSADLSVTGATTLARAAPTGTPAVSFDGEVTLTNFASVDKAKSEDFLKWNTLFAGGVAYQHNPMQLAIEQVALSDFYSRIIIYPEGRLNLQNIIARPQEAAAAGHAQRGAAARTQGTAAQTGRGGPAPVAAERAAPAPAAADRPTPQRDARAPLSRRSASARSRCRAAT